jgi:hypothetical protein
MRPCGVPQNRERLESRRARGKAKGSPQVQQPEAKRLETSSSSLTSSTSPWFRRLPQLYHTPPPSPDSDATAEASPADLGLGLDDAMETHMSRMNLPYFELLRPEHRRKQQLSNFYLLHHYCKMFIME